MLKKILHYTGLVAMGVVCACTSNINKRPVARNKPSTLFLSDKVDTVVQETESDRTRNVAPIDNLEEEVLYSPVSREEIYIEEKNATKILDGGVSEPKTEIIEEETVSVSNFLPAESSEEKRGSFSLSLFKKRKSEDGNLRIALMLPIDKQNTRAAQDLKNAATMALFDAKSKNTIMQIYTTNGTYDGAKVKAKIAYEDGADVIVGPLFADEVKGVNAVIGGEIPVVSFTTDPTALGANVYSIGFLMEQQVKKLVEYATLKGKNKFAVIVPNSESGRFIKEYFDIYTKEYGANVVSSAMYNKNSKDLMNAVKNLANFDERKEKYNTYKGAVKNRYNYLLSLRSKNPEKFATAFDKKQFASSEAEVAALGNELSSIEKKMTITPPKFDTVFIFGDDINDVVMIGSALMYYDVHPSKVKYLGTAQLENPKVYNERAFRGAWFPSVTTKYNEKFNTAYEKYFGREPMKIASLAYDAISLVNSIGTKKGYLTKEDLLNQSGWTGINGVFRFKPNGSSERNMDIKEVVGGATEKTKIIAPAGTKFLHN